MRRIPMIGAITGLALVLAACGGGSDNDTDPKASTALEGRGEISFVTGKDTSGNLQKQIDTWNAAHPDEPVKVIELSDKADEQRQQMVQNAQVKSDAYTVLNLDVVWTAEFAANRWVVELPEAELPIADLLAPTVDTGRYLGKLYGVPIDSDAGLLYYRKDLLTEAGIDKAPTTWTELFAACDTVKEKVSSAKDIDCYAGQFDKYEGLTVNASEAINAAGGAVVDEQGKPTVNTPEAKAGLDVLVNAFKDGHIAKKAITYTEELGRADFNAGKLLFHRQWPYQYASASNKEESKVAGKFDVAPLPGSNGPGVSTLGGHDFAISAFAPNKATALDFIKYMASPEVQKANALVIGKAPSVAALYNDAEIVAKFPYMPSLKTAIENAQGRPKVVKYGDVTTAIQEAAYAALNGDKPTDQALSELQAKLETLTQ
ncbi:carbohydrate ABC transporter substrate-binding protein (CUT1 family) [Actinocorallia herbida]|uniref:Carbohydrate ABC transporter substrate-binding protein (CUT1 family) n=1 Tax=Actinocorallia herbida TaxID=58109 RepID=A0A3N1D6Z2_9ACTN|nr:ABC transporter substrate-binding protein [Actinocorallia herbida]ROO89229.1 carbohydrate ABC transporter substrate-binding protein (CUT1 family) [Actinocorallia herbida]